MTRMDRAARVVGGVMLVALGVIVLTVMVTVGAAWLTYLLSRLVLPG